MEQEQDPQKAPGQNALDWTASLISGRLGHYRIKRLIGEGATARVYLAEHIFLKRLTAVKVLTCDFAQWPDFDLTLFERTAVAAATLNHPNIVTLFDLDEVNARPFLLMEYVDGESLYTRIKAGGALPPAKALRILRDVALALGHAHAAGLVHCDVKPANILLTRAGQPKVTDFGLSQALNRGDRNPLADMIVGTPAYLSPEQAQARRPDERSDLYSLGITFYEMLTGRTPWDGADTNTVMQNHCEASRSFIGRGLSSAALTFEPVLHRLLAQEPVHRYQSAGELLTELRPYLRRFATTARKSPDVRGKLARLGELRDRARQTNFFNRTPNRRALQ
jgi:serine/threonine-protein kinase